MTANQEWRTPPLWGVADSGPWLHDGRAATLTEAIEQHSGEALQARLAFHYLSSTDRAQLIDFLEQLKAPEAK